MEKRRVNDTRLINEQYRVEFYSVERNTRDLDDLVDGFWIPER